MWSDGVVIQGQALYVDFSLLPDQEIIGTPHEKL